MQDLRLLDAHRLRDPDAIAWFGGPGDHSEGAFMVPSPVDRSPLMIIASTGMGWDHVSISRRNRPPNQTELACVFRLFFKDTETAVQYFVPPSEHVNNMPYCLHLFRPQQVMLPKPLSIMVGMGNKPVSNAAEARALHEEAMRNA